MGIGTIPKIYYDTFTRNNKMNEWSWNIVSLIEKKNLLLTISNYGNESELQIFFV